MTDLSAVFNRPYAVTISLVNRGLRPGRRAAGAGGGGTKIQTMTAPAASAAGGLRQRAGLPVLTWPAFDPLPVEAIVTTRHGGVSAGRYATLNLSFAVGDEVANVRENRRRAAAALGADPADFVFAAQVHGRRAEVVSAADRGRGTLAVGDAVGPADALVTAAPGTVLAILVADCVPIILYDPAAHVLACVHAGWRGTVARTAEAALAAMCSLGTRPRDVIAGIGPSVAAGSYQVGEEVARATRDAFGEEVARATRDAFGEEVAGAARDVSGGQAAGAARDASGGQAAGAARDASGGQAAGAARDVSGEQTPGLLRPAPAGGPGEWLFDLPAANRHVLRTAGVPDGQIHVAATSTGPDPGLFFSHRAERPCGRFALAARLEPRGQR
jgi:YfiH family protein